MGSLKALGAAGADFRHHNIQVRMVVSTVENLDEYCGFNASQLFELLDHARTRSFLSLSRYAPRSSPPLLPNRLEPLVNNEEALIIE